MDIRQISEEFAVSPQIAIADLPAIAGRGFVALICNRPGGEEPGQPSIDETREVAQAAGLAFHHIPVSGGDFPDAAIRAFRAVRKGSEGPVLAYCRTGMRSITLETLANTDGLDADERLSRAGSAGYDLSAISGLLG
jgi:sulfide:quinone oxidoreductase